jgi:hypothetical protein
MEGGFVLLHTSIKEITQIIGTAGTIWGQNGINEFWKLVNISLFISCHLVHVHST